MGDWHEKDGKIYIYRGGDELLIRNASRERKPCRKCGVSKEATPANFPVQRYNHKSKRRTHGFIRNTCIPCAGHITRLPRELDNARRRREWRTATEEQKERSRARAEKAYENGHRSYARKAEWSVVIKAKSPSGWCPWCCKLNPKRLLKRTKPLTEKDLRRISRAGKARAEKSKMLTHVRERPRRCSCGFYLREYNQTLHDAIRAIHERCWSLRGSGWNSHLWRVDHLYYVGNETPPKDYKAGQCGCVHCKKDLERGDRAPDGGLRAWSADFQRWVRIEEVAGRCLPPLYDTRFRPFTAAPVELGIQ